MKYLLLLVFSLGLTATIQVNAQRTILNPEVGLNQNNSSLKITKVELLDSVTVLYFRTKASPGTWIRIPGNTYIQPAGDTAKYWVRGTEGIPFDKEYYMPDSGVARYAVYFPAINKKTAVLDYGEDAPNGWKIFDIQLTRPAASLIPDFLNKEWYDRNSGDLTYAFYDTVALWSGLVFDYADFRKKEKNSYTATIRNESQKIELSIRRLSDTAIRIIRNGVPSVYFSDRKACSIRHDDGLYVAPVLKKGTALLTGYVRNYNAKRFPKNIMVYVNDILSGSQENVLIEITQDGRFRKEIPLYNPEDVFMTYGFSREQLYLEPGRQLFVLLGSDEAGFMGNLAGINEDLQRVANLHLFDYNRVARAPVMSPDSFKTYVFDCAGREMHIIDSLYARKEIGRKAYQVKKIEERYSYLNTAMEYHYIYHDAPAYPAGYFNFITPAIANDPLAFLSVSYYFFINRIKFAEPLRQPFAFTLNFRETIEALKKAGIPLSENDKMVYAHMNADGTSIRQDSAEGSRDSLFKTFTSEHNAFIQKRFQQRSEEFYYNKYDSAFALCAGSQAIDIMRSQDILTPIVESLTPKDDSSLKEATAVLKNPFIREHIFEENERTIRQLAVNKNASGYTINTTPQVAADKIFDSIMAKYRGKVVYVDFWATWCSPCRAGIKEIAPLKEELKGQNIVFVYITNETSPEETYKNMTPVIKGEHYRLNQDQYNYLAAKFQITGIPYYVLVDKAGKVIKTNLGFNSNEDLKDLFRKYL